MATVSQNNKQKMFKLLVEIFSKQPILIALIVLWVVLGFASKHFWEIQNKYFGSISTDSPHGRGYDLRHYYC
ncbi:MAG: hypothetical protein ACYC38_12930 [Eubacteriales bacterium]